MADGTITTAARRERFCAGLRKVRSGCAAANIACLIAQARDQAPTLDACVNPAAGLQASPQPPSIPAPTPPLNPPFRLALPVAPPPRQPNPVQPLQLPPSLPPQPPPSTPQLPAGQPSQPMIDTGLEIQPPGLPLQPPPATTLQPNSQPLEPLPAPPSASFPPGQPQQQPNPPPVQMPFPAGASLSLAPSPSTRAVQLLVPPPPGRAGSGYGANAASQLHQLLMSLSASHSCRRHDGLTGRSRCPTNLQGRAAPQHQQQLHRLPRWQRIAGWQQCCLQAMRLRPDQRRRLGM
jgi:hypothetical protein